MIYFIENDFLFVKVSTLGAELTSIKNKDNGVEYLWQGDEDYWSGQAPIMFPICGRLYEGKYTYMGKEYTMPNHGIARSSEFSVTSQKDDEITLSLVSNEKTKENYPFDFIFNVTYKITNKTLTVKYTVINKDTKELIFAVGGHPAFNVPLNEEGNFEDYYVEFSNECCPLRVDFSSTCFCTKNDKLYAKSPIKKINLTHNLFDDDAIFLYNVDKVITLKSDSHKYSITMKYDRMKYVGLWHMPKTDAPYVCIEPWTSIPANDGVIDNLMTKEEMIHLPVGYNYTNSYSITVK